MLMGGVPGVSPAEVVVIGEGIVGTNAAKMAVGLGANVTILDVNTDRLRQLDDMFRGRLKTLASNSYNIAESVKKADLVVGAVLIPGARAPQLVTEEMIKTMQPGSVVVDVAIDQGGSIETIEHITTHSDPTYEKHGVGALCGSQHAGRSRPYLYDGADQCNDPLWRSDCQQRI